MNAKEVIRIGRRRRRQASSTAASGFEAFLLFILGELDDQNRVLTRQAHQYDQADLGEDVVVAARSDHPGNGRQQGHRHDQDHRQWQAPAFVLRREHQERQQYAEREHEQRGVAGQNLLVGQVGPFVGHAVGQFFLEQFLDGFFGLAGAVAGGCGTVDFSGDEAVVVHHAVRARGVADLDEGRQRDHLALVVAHFQLADLVRIRGGTAARPGR